jgi:hypothetical protein
MNAALVVAVGLGLLLVLLMAGASTVMRWADHGMPVVPSDVHDRINETPPRSQVYGR